MSKSTVTRHEIFQTSLMSALLDGVYEDEMTVADLLSRGSFGIGTFNGLDGEMLIIDGTCYQLRADGGVSKADLGAYTPYAVVTNFVPHIESKLPQNIVRTEASKFIDKMTASQNYMYALRIDGDFEWIRMRTVVKQEKPYRPMVEATDEDAIIELHDVS
ncbi:MAG TPA: acetolactate decarboxylase, partial [Cryobacterium sp.]|nr:acetolactate decarboxylase [Cryobacterium sp.]